MNAPCPFDAEQLTFTGSPVEQARCLLRFVKRAGEVDDTPATLPQSLIDLLSNPLNLGITKTRPANTHWDYAGWSRPFLAGYWRAE